MSFNTGQNKEIVIRFNKECIEKGIPESFDELLSDNVVNHSVREGMPNGKESFYFFIINVLRHGFSNLKVDILSQISEGDLVASRKKITATHTGEIFGIAPSHKQVEINIIDIIRLQDGQYVEHWGQSNFEEVLKQISEK